MRIISKVLKNANITLVADNLSSGIVGKELFADIIDTGPSNLVQIPPLGLIEYPQYNFIVDVNNRRVIINHKEGATEIEQSIAPKIALKFIRQVKGPQIVAAGFNYALELAFDDDFSKYSTATFVSDKIKDNFGEKLSGFGIKAFLKQDSAFVILNVEPSVSDTAIALATGNFHYEIHDIIDYEKDFITNYNIFKEYLNGLFR